MRINWFAITIISIWFICGITGIFTQDGNWCLGAIIITVILGIGYLMEK